MMHPVIGFGIAPKPDSWLGPRATGAGSEVLHEPRIWPEYHPNYFAAFVRDPDGNNVEAVCHNAEAA